MKRLGLFPLLALAVAITFTPQSVCAEESPDAVLKAMLNGIETANVEKLTTQAEPDFKARMTQQVATKISTSFGPKLKAGYTMQCIGQLKQQGLKTYLYKLEFKDNSDDVLVRLAIRDGHVSGFFLE